MDIGGHETFVHVNAAAARMDHAQSIAQGEALRVQYKAVQRRSTRSKLIVALLTLAALVAVGVLIAL